MNITREEDLISIQKNTDKEEYELSTKFSNIS